MKEIFSVWGVLNFVALLLLLRHWLKKTSRGFFSARYHRIHKVLTDASNDLVESEGKLQESKNKFSKLDDELKRIRTIVEEAALYEAWMAVEKGEIEAGKVQVSMRSYIERLKKMSLIDMERELMKKSFEFSAKELSKGIDEEKKRELLQRAIDDLGDFKSLLETERQHLFGKQDNFRMGYRYAYAYFLLLREKGALKSGEEGIVSFLKLLDDEPNLKEILFNQDASKKIKKEIIKNIFLKNDGENLKQFLFILIDKGRMKHFTEIADIYLSLCMKEEAAYPIEIAVTSGEEASLGLKAIEKKLGKEMKHKLIPKIIIDPSLIGGVRLKINDKTFDATVKGRWQRMYDSFRGGFS